MTSELDFMKLCRLCLIKDGVKVPIFGNTNEVEQLFSKISSCLPVKVSQDDKLPKKICEPCLQKVDSLYQFWNTAANAEKQLLQWLEKVNVNMNAEENSSTQIDKPQEHSTTTNVVCKQECDAEIQDDSDSFQDNGFQVFDASYSPQPNTSTMTTNILRQRLLTSKSDTSSNSEEKNAKKTKEVQNNDSDDEMLGNRVAKQEVNSDEDYEESDQMLQPTAFVDVPCDADQPGPSGLNKTTAESGCILWDTSQMNVLEDDFYCAICDKKFNTRRKFRCHKRRHGEKKYECTICHKKFIEKSEKDIHEQKHIEPKKFECEICSKKLNSYYNLDQHIRRIHTKNYPMKCGQCGKGHFSQSDLDFHINVDHKGLRLHCETCGKYFKNPGQFRFHINTHEPGYEPKKYICRYCDKEFGTPSSLNSHSRKIHLNQRYVCSVCGILLTSITSLANHEKKHSGVRSFACPACPKTFIGKIGLRTHMRVHTKEKPYHCELCNKNFTQRSSLVIHIRCHTGEKPYECKICNKRFVTKTLMNTHSNRVHGMPLHMKITSD